MKENLFRPLADIMSTEYLSSVSGYDITHQDGIQEYNEGLVRPFLEKAVEKLKAFEKLEEIRDYPLFPRLWTKTKIFISNLYRTTFSTTSPDAEE